MKFFRKKRPYGADLYRIENATGYTKFRLTSPKDVISAIYFDDGERVGRITNFHTKPRLVIGRMLIVAKYVQSRSRLGQRWSTVDTDPWGLRAAVVVKDNVDTYLVRNIEVDGAEKTEEGWVSPGGEMVFPSKIQPVGKYYPLEEYEPKELVKTLSQIIASHTELAPFYASLT